MFKDACTEYNYEMRAVAHGFKEACAYEVSISTDDVTRESRAHCPASVLLTALYFFLGALYFFIK